MAKNLGIFVLEPVRLLGACKQGSQARKDSTTGVLVMINLMDQHFLDISHSLNKEGNFLLCSIFIYMSEVEADVQPTCHNML